MSLHNGTSFTWAIHNFSYCWSKCDEAIESPMFCIYTPEETKWKLLLFPRGVATVDDSISIYLYRDKNCKGIEKIKVDYCPDILDKDGSGLDNIPTTDEFQKDMRKGFPRFTTREFVHEYLQEDILTVRCIILRLGGKAVTNRQIFARTIIGIEKRIFQCPIENFSKLEPNQKQSFLFKTDSKEFIMQINITSDGKGNILFGILPYDECMKFSVVKIFMTDSQKQDVDCGDYEYWFSYGKCAMLATKLKKRELIKNKRLHLPENALLLRFELTISTGFAFSGIEKDSWEYTLHPFPNKAYTDWRKCFDHKNLSDCPCTLITDLTTLQKKRGKCDMKLKTKSKTFSVHTLILSSRSPVFEAMFSSEMEEQTKGYVDMSDFDEETVRQFLLYLYSDQLEDLEWDDVFELYKISDKYAVISLRDKCCRYLKDNLSLENACNTLILSHMHCSRELKELAQNYILKNAKVIFKSEQWKKLAKTNSKLAYETTLLNWNEE